MRSIYLISFNKLTAVIDEAVFENKRRGHRQAIIRSFAYLLYKNSSAN